MATQIKALVVDDEPDVEFLFRQRFRKELRDGTIKLDFAFSGEQAIDFLSAGGAANVVLVLSDINMPGMTGLELLRRVKEAYPDIRVMMITAYGNDSNYQKALEFGADGYLAKPIDFSSLKEKIQSFAPSD